MLYNTLSNNTLQILRAVELQALAAVKVSGTYTGALCASTTNTT
jgi:hypothetical protein